jgi:hypothetical protein
MKLIDKDVLTEKLWERRIKHREFGGSPHSEYGHEDDEILSLIDTLEVKEVDLEEEIDNYLQPLAAWEIQEAPFTSMENIAKHFFELGIKVAQKG